MGALHVTDADFREKVLNSDKPVLVDFWATWCGPCRQMGPIVDELADEMGEKVVVAKLDVDENPATAQNYGITSIPTFLVFQGGDIVKSIVGGRPKKELVDLLNSLA